MLVTRYQRQNLRLVETEITCKRKFKYSSTRRFNPLPDDTILCLPKVRAFADDKLNVTQNIKDVFHRIESIVGKEENAGYQHFLLFKQCFQKAFSSIALKVVFVW